MQGELVPKVRTALLRMIIYDVRSLIESGQFEDALPIAMDAVVKGQALYYPKAPLNLVPVYLLAVQVIYLFIYFHIIKLIIYLLTQCRRKWFEPL